MESVIWGVPAVAFSLNTNESHLGSIDYTQSAAYASYVTQTVMKHRIPAGILLNVNIPYQPGSEIKGF